MRTWLRVRLLRQSKPLLYLMIESGQRRLNQFCPNYFKDLFESVIIFKDLLDELENEDIPATIREARMAHLKRKAKDLLEMKKMDHGIYKSVHKSNVMMIGIY